MMADFDIEAYSYHLPQENIAQAPAPDRDASRLLVLDRGTGAMHHRRFPDILEYLAPHDLLVVNDTRVFPARLLGKKDTGGRMELFLLEYPRVVSTAEQPSGGSDRPQSWSEAAAIGLLNTLGYRSEKTLDLDSTPGAFLAEFDKRDRKFRKDKAGCKSGLLVK